MVDSLKEMIDELKEEHGGEFPDTHDEDHLDRCVEEILDDVEMYEAGRGPEGPWYYRSLMVRRIMNRIIIYDVDERVYDIIEVPDLSKEKYTDEPKEALREKLDRSNTESLEVL